MTKFELFEILEEYDDNIEIRINDINNIHQSVPIKGIEPHRDMKGNIKNITLLSHKNLGYDWQP